MPMIATNVTGSVRRVCTAKTSKTTTVSTMPAISTEARDPVSALRRYAASEVMRKIASATALPKEAIAVRSTKYREEQHGDDRDHQAACSADPGELAEDRGKHARLRKLGS